MKKFNYIDLFCGIGGFHQAMESLGGKCVFASDIDEDCRKTYESNYEIQVAGDITKIEAKDIPSHDVLCAGFPCQSFSKAGKRLGFEDETKGTLFFDICRIMEYHKPKYALLENVRNLASHDKGNTWRVIHDNLEALGYNLLSDPVIFSPHYLGIPQHRERVYIMCVRKDIGEIKPFVFDKKKKKHCTIESILLEDNDIPNLSEYHISHDMEELIDLWNEFLQNIVVDKLPGFPIWSDRLCELNPNEDLKHYPNWKQNFIRKNNKLYLDNKEFIDNWLVRAKRNPLFFGAKAKLEWQAGQTTHPDIWNQIFQLRPSGIRVKVNSYFPALVAIVQTSIIGSRRRFLTPRECASLQSFPDSFQPDEKTIQAYKQFGNAVNVECVKLFAKHMFQTSGLTILHTNNNQQAGMSSSIVIKKNHEIQIEVREVLSLAPPKTGNLLWTNTSKGYVTMHAIIKSIYEALPNYRGRRLDISVWNKTTGEGIKYNGHKVPLKGVPRSL